MAGLSKSIFCHLSGSSKLVFPGQFTSAQFPSSISIKASLKTKSIQFNTQNLTESASSTSERGAVKNTSVISHVK